LASLKPNLEGHRRLGDNHATAGTPAEGKAKQNGDGGPSAGPQPPAAYLCPAWMQPQLCVSLLLGAGGVWGDRFWGVEKDLLSLLLGKVLAFGAWNQQKKYFWFFVIH